MKMRVVAVVALVALAACDATGATQTTTVSAPDGLETNAVIDFVIDGDTVDVIINGSEERVRLIGIDTPKPRSATAQSSASDPRPRRSPNSSCRSARRCTSNGMS